MNYKKIILLLSVFALVFTTACDDDTTETIYGNWVKKAAFSGNGRAEAVAFTIGNTFYYGLGYNGNNSGGYEYMNDFYSFQGGNSWSRMSDFPGTVRGNVTSFAVDGKGYFICGYNENSDSLFSDVWQYDPATDAWTQLPDFTAGKRADATAFVVDGTAYVVGGRTENDGDKKDCYVFNSTTGVFTYDDNLDISQKRYGATSFVIGNKAYVVGGYHSGYVAEVEVFDATTKEWIVDGARKLYLSSSITEDISHYDDILDLRRVHASSFVIGDKAYLIGGNYSNTLNDCWEYDASTDLWTEMNSFPFTMSGRYQAAGFSIDDNPFIVGGTNATTYFDDVWTFIPTEEDDDTDD